MIQGSLKFSGLAIGEVTLNKMGPTLKMEAKAAFIDPRTNLTHGWTTGNQWSPPTVAKLGELLALMEADMARVHFENGSTESDATGAAAVTKAAAPGGLGEHVTARDGDSI